LKSVVRPPSLHGIERISKSGISSLHTLQAWQAKSLHWFAFRQ
jgi:hypothetical protein